MELIMPNKDYYDRNRQKCIDAARAWALANPDKARASRRETARRIQATPEGRERLAANSKRYVQSHPEEVQRRYKEWQAKHPEYNQQYLMKRAQLLPEKYLFWQAKRRAKLRGVEFALELSDIVIPDVCPVLGIPISLGFGKRGRAESSPSLDRFDNSKGYVPGNVRVISMRANWLKSNGSLAEFEAIVRYMRGE